MYRFLIILYLHFLLMRAILFVVVFFLIFCIRILSQDIKFERITLRDGLSSNVITTIVQDNTGFIWFGTANGLNRYNGFRVDVFQHNPADSVSISSNRISVLFVDSRKNLWVGTNGEGLNLYDPVFEKFTRFKTISNDTNSLYSNRIWSITEDSSHNLWIVTDGAVQKYNYQKKYFSRISLPANFTGPSIGQMGPKFFFEGLKGEYWLCTWVSGIIKFSLSTGRWQHYHTHNGSGLIDNAINAFSKINDQIFIGTRNGGICLYNRRSNSFISYRHNPESLNSLSNNKIGAIHSSSMQQIWIGTEGSGLDLVETGNSGLQFKNYRSRLNDFTSLCDDNVKAIFSDRSGVIWVGTGNGVNKYSPVKEKFTCYSSTGHDGSLSNNNVTGILQDRKERVWIATWGGGINRFDVAGKRFFYYLSEPGGKSALGDNAIRQLFENSKGQIFVVTRNGIIGRYNEVADRFEKLFSFESQLQGTSDYFNISILDQSDNLWMGSYLSGVFCYSTIDGTYFNLNKKIKNLPVSEVSALLAARDSSIWISIHNNSIYIYSPKTDKLHRIKADENDSTALHGGAISAFYQDSKRFVWSCGNNNVTNRINPKTFEIQHYPFTLYGCLMEENDELWLGTNKGLKLLDLTDNSFYSYTVDDGLANNSVYTIFSDSRKNLWMATDYGISMLNVQNETFHNFDFNDGLNDYTFSRGIGVKLVSGEMIFRGENGLNVVNPEYIRYNDNIPNIVITGLWLQNRNIKIGDKINDRIMLNKSISMTDEVKISYKNYSFTIEYAALDFVTPEKNQYSYMLEGLDEEWINTDKNMVTYTNLNPGSYVFKVKASNNDGKWNENPVLLKVIIIPPFYKTVLFKVIAGIILVVLIGVFYYTSVTLTRRQNIRLNAKVEQRTMELNKQKELLAKLSNSKNKLFSIIGNDLKKPFRDIISIGYKLVLDINNMDKEQITDQVKVITTTCENSVDMLDNLVAWTRLNEDSIAFNPETFDLNTVVQENIQLLRATASNKMLKVFSDNTEIMVFADKYMIENVVRNILVTVIKYARNGDDIIIEYIENPKEIEVHVMDTGTGIDAHTREQYIKQDIALSSTVNDSGMELGLMLSKQFVSINNGEINIESQFGKGTTITFKLPRTV